jgi:hypothetical protein
MSPRPVCLLLLVYPSKSSLTRLAAFLHALPRGNSEYSRFVSRPDANLRQIRRTDKSNLVKTRKLNLQDPKMGCRDQPHWTICKQSRFPTPILKVRQHGHKPLTFIIRLFNLLTIA